MYFRESLGVRDNKSRLYFVFTNSTLRVKIAVGQLVKIAAGVSCGEMYNKGADLDLLRHCCPNIWDNYSTFYDCTIFSLICVPLFYPQRLSFSILFTEYKVK